MLKLIMLLGCDSGKFLFDIGIICLLRCGFLIIFFVV